MPLDVTEHRIDPFGVDLMLLGGSKTIPAPEDEIVGPLLVSLWQTRLSMFAVAVDFG